MNPTGFNDADMEQAGMEAAARRVAFLRSQGVCTHGSVRGMIGPASQKEWDLSPVLCLDCGRQFRLGRDWYQARREALDT